MKSLVINKKDLVHNINVLKNFSQMQILRNEKKYQIIAVVKGNGYGLGLVEYSQILIDNGIDCLAVSTFEEAVILRRAGIAKDILMLSSTAIKEELELLIKEDIIITIGSENVVKIINEIAEKHKEIRVHVAIDTGFGRYGFLYNDENFLKTIKSLKSNVKIDGIFSHFSLSYYKNNKWTNTQFNRFLDVLHAFRAAKINIDVAHICNSSGYINYPKMHLNATRIGSAFLGRVERR